MGDIFLEGEGDEKLVIFKVVLKKEVQMTEIFRQSGHQERSS